MRPVRPAPPTSTNDSTAARDVFDRVFKVLEAMEENQRLKVIELARRLKPGLTAEDIRNPHDFPDLDDPDWHFEDGQLTGIQSAMFALRAMSRDVLGDGEAAQSEVGEENQGEE